LAKETRLTVPLFPVGKNFVGSTAGQFMILLGFVIGLTGCGISRQLEQDEAAAPPLNLNDALAECRNSYPDQITQAVARAACIIKATEPLRPLLPFPDMLDKENSFRKMLAEQVQKGSISLLERNGQMTKFHAGLVGEEQARMKEKPEEVAAPPLAVRQWRLSNPAGCMSLGGNTSECY
jgi:hypothetical protein